LWRDAAALVRVVALFVAITLAGFALNVASGMRYTRLSAGDPLRHAVGPVPHLQRLSPRFYARTRLGDIVSRINNDVAEIQRIAAETALAWVGTSCPRGTIAMLVWLDSRLSLLTAAFFPRASGPWCATAASGRARGGAAPVERPDIGSFLNRDAPGMKLVLLSNAADARWRASQPQQRFIRALLEMQLPRLSLGRPAGPDPFGPARSRSFSTAGAR